jgi:hypothetical protein
MNPRTYLIYGFEGGGGTYLVIETPSASEARDHRDARNASGFRTVVYSTEGELSVQELDRFVDLEDRY